ncbi:hypothetical protein JTB14_021101 [Gonioctena quinquepunctata]|nr:hypothetical protein JTB14_021101 [Gonioctena quinquepunctata]
MREKQVYFIRNLWAALKDAQTSVRERNGKRESTPGAFSSVMLAILKYPTRKDFYCTRGNFTPTRIPILKISSKSDTHALDTPGRKLDPAARESVLSGICSLPRADLLEVLFLSLGDDIARIPDLNNFVIAKVEEKVQQNTINEPSGKRVKKEQFPSLPPTKRSVFHDPTNVNRANDPVICEIRNSIRNKALTEITTENFVTLKETLSDINASIGFASTLSTENIADTRTILLRDGIHVPASSMLGHMARAKRADRKEQELFKDLPITLPVNDK